MKKTRIIDFYVIILILAAILGIGLRTHALLLSFDDATKLFTDKTTITIGNLLVSLSVLFFGGYLLFGEKERDLVAKSDNAASFIPAVPVCISLLYLAAEKLLSSPITQIRSEADMYSFISSVLAILSVISFFLSVFIERRESTFKAAASLATVFFLATYSVYLYYNKSVHPTNSPNKIIDQISFLFCAIFFLYETRISLGRAKWRPYVSFGLMATLLSAYSAIPSLICLAVNGHTISDSIAESVVSLAVSIYIGSKVIQSGLLTPDVECDEAMTVSAMAEARREEIRDYYASRAQDSDKEVDSDTVDASNYTFDIPYIDQNVDLGSDTGADDIQKTNDVANDAPTQN